MRTHEARNGTEQNKMNQGAHQLKFIYESSDIHISCVAPSSYSALLMCSTNINTVLPQLPGTLGTKICSDNQKSG